MKFKKIEEFLSSTDVLEIDALKRIASPNNILMYQAYKDIKAGENGVKSRDSGLDVQKVKSFLKIAKEERVDIAITPEYTVPWEGILEYLSDDCYPAYGKLWILGFESISRDELKNFLEEDCFNTIKIIYEESGINTNRFLDPLIYFTWMRSDGEFKKLIVIQFKTGPMGARGVEPVEKQNLEQGENIYIFKNTAEPSIDLFSLICAEALEFNKLNMSSELDSSNWYDRPHIIFSLQLNPKPFHTEFTEFRKKATFVEFNDLISINLAENSKINGHKVIDYGASSIFVKTKEPKLDKSRIKNNESLGMYVMQKNPELYAYYFCPEECLFQYKVDRPSYSGCPGALNQKEGPVMKELYKWENNNFKKAQFNMNLNDLLSEYGYIDLLNFNDCNLERERLVEYSIGQLNLKKKEEWFKVENLAFFKLEANDVSNRVTIPFHIDSSTIDSRNQKMSRFKELIDLVNNDSEFFKPRNYKYLTGKSRKVEFVSGDTEIKSYIYNINVEDDEDKCTSIFIGNSNSLKAKQIHDELSKVINDGYKKKIVIWYKFGNQLQFYELDLPTFTDADEVGSIAG